ncbi:MULTISPECIES: helix-turn-helix transcriptional regulator [Bacillus]|uniref:helix-turn-helix transcriptional regulator n=1 Tax=Bacillus TaxID=1386 RepID=UPI0006ADD02C|nr:MULTISPECIES: helix-turn-helix transcriptional regulator [Bacillus]ARJ76188.1 transcriptional regulator [Bacillus velezensis]AWD88898.1 XRE family transcriptional regulator [Bacillus velezensis]KAF6691088.1 helix-turn-helix transcriptional regulator [Bacillus sp. EKM601B]KOS49300.1 XRE family transcriptional regulator [Bacillus amyloliquefaciens]MBA9148543.1 helix-turn-helix transcriptional regulator [Bacillus sp. EKM213B]
MTENERIGRIIRNFRLREKMSSADFALLVGVSQGTVSNIENGKFGQRKNSLQTVKRIIEICEIDLPPDIADFLDIEPEPTNENDDTEKILVASRDMWDVTSSTSVAIQLRTFVNGKDLDDGSEKERDSREKSYIYESDVVVNTLMEFIEENKKEIRKKVLENLREKSLRFLKQYKDIEEDD